MNLVQRQIYLEHVWWDPCCLKNFLFYEIKLFFFFFFILFLFPMLEWILCSTQPQIVWGKSLKITCGMEEKEEKIKIIFFRFIRLSSIKEFIQNLIYVYLYKTTVKFCKVMNEGNEKCCHRILNMNGHSMVCYSSG